MAYHYSDQLRDEFERRCSSNARYSLRAFARDLKMSPSRLSMVLRKKQGMSIESAQRLLTRCDWTELEKKRFLVSVQFYDGRSKTSREEAKNLVTKLEGASSQERRLEEDAFKVVSEWHYYAILELVELKNFREDPHWIGRALGIRPEVAQRAVERLLRLGLLGRKRGVLFQTDAIVTVGDGGPSPAIRSFNRQMVQKALAAIDVQQPTERYLGNLVVAVSKKDLAYVANELKKFRRGINSYLETANRRRKRDAVYCLSTQFFRISEEIV